MKKYALLFILLLLPLRTAWSADSELLDRVVAVVNDEPITQSELDVYLRPLYQQYKEEYKGDEQLLMALNEARRKLLNQIIEDRLVYQEAKNQKIEIDEVEIDQDMLEFKKKFKSEPEMEESMKREGMTFTTVRDRLKRQALVRRLHDIEIRSKIVISPLEIENYYNERPEEFTQEDRLHVRSITLKKSDEAKEKGLTDEAARNKMSDFRKKIKTSEDFSKIAKEFSEDTHAKGGGLGDWIHRGDMIPVIDEVIFKMNPGETSDIIETPMGYHLFRVEEKQKGHKRTLDEARDDIFEKLFRQKGAERFREWMEELKRRAYISIR